MSNTTIAYKLSPPDVFFTEISQVLPSQVIGNKFILSKELGKGNMQYLKVQNGLWAQQIDYTLHEGIELFRLPKKTNDYFLIDFYLSDTEIVRSAEGKTFKQSFENVSMVLSSSTTASKAIIPKNKRINIFNLLLSRDWILKNIVTDHISLQDFFTSDAPIYMSENLDYKLKKLLKQINFNQNNRLTSMSNIIQIIDYLFVRFNKRKMIASNVNIHPDDLNKLLQVRAMLDENPEKDILLNDLAVIAGMSLSKFKRLFKQVLGTTPYRYHLKNKMEKAMEMLQQGKYSVSETGFLMGYANLSHFSKAFKNHFGILPSETNI